MNSYIFRWGSDTYIINANWGNPSSNIKVNGRDINGNVGTFNHSPRKVAKHIIEECCNAEGLNLQEKQLQDKIEKVLNGLD